MKAKGPDEIEPLQFVQYLQSFLSYDQQINFCSQQCSTMQCTLYSVHLCTAFLQLFSTQRPVRNQLIMIEKSVFPLGKQ